MPGMSGMGMGIPGMPGMMGGIAMPMPSAGGGQPAGVRMLLPKQPMIPPPGAAAMLARPFSEADMKLMENAKRAGETFAEGGSH